MKTKIGLLPLYLKLYDDTTPEYRPRLEKYLEEITKELEKRGLEVLSAPICRTKEEFEAAVDLFEKSGLDAVVTLHLAYSPSLCSEQALKRLSLPIIILDTTCDEIFDYYTDEDLIMYNHGIHGVQDMCNLLRRNGKSFIIHAGYYKTTDVLDRVVNTARICAVANALKHAKVGIIGQPFEGMGDFAVPFERLKSTIGITVQEVAAKDFAIYPQSIGAAEIEKEKAVDKEKYTFAEGLSEKTIDLSLKTCLGVRKWLAENKFSAFTINFLVTEKDGALPTMPFCEACKAMARGIGYAGEGDVLTAAFVGALLKSFPKTTFAEMFCPNWRDHLIYLSHMGEFNEAVAQEKPMLVEQDFPYTSAENPTSLVASFSDGNAVYANLAPRSNGKYALILSNIEMQRVPQDNAFKNNINGWFRPVCGLEEFLEKFSRAGGTHHGAIVYGQKADDLAALAQICNFELVMI